MKIRKEDRFGPFLGFALILHFWIRGFSFSLSVLCSSQQPGQQGPTVRGVWVGSFYVVVF